MSIVFFVVYQQFENSVLSPLVMHRTTRISPLTVLISVLVGVELIGYWGAVFAIPVAATLKVFVAAVWQETRIAESLVDPEDSESSPLAEETSAASPPPVPAGRPDPRLYDAARERGWAMGTTRARWGLVVFALVGLGAASLVAAPAVSAASHATRQAPRRHDGWWWRRPAPREAQSHRTPRATSRITTAA